MQLPIACFLSKHTTLGAAGIGWMLPIAGAINTLIAPAYRKWERWRSTRRTEAQKPQTRVSEEIQIAEGSS